VKITVVAVGHKMPVWVKEACQDYLKRFPPDFPIELFEIRPAVRAESSIAERLMDEEARRIEEKIPKHSTLIVMDERGAQWTTRELSSALQDYHNQAEELCFVIGGADGLSPALKSKACRQLALSRMTLPHALARIFLIEQLYRAISLLKNHPYHRD
jgi:23S rRNA (pseudouridine1915-N3)-methyltransferase